MSRYDSRTTTFSPEGRLYQVEYAMEAIGKAGTPVGILSSAEGVVLASEKKVLSKLLDLSVNGEEKTYRVSDTITVSVAGITSDANILIDFLRAYAQDYASQYGEAVPVETLVKRVCDRKQSYTQYGGLRPFGTAFLYAGWDRYLGFQLYQSDPSGNYNAWKATAIGANSRNAMSTLKAEYTDDITLDDALLLALKILTKSMDTSKVAEDRIEIGYLAFDPVEKSPRWKALSGEQVKKLIARLPAPEDQDDDN